VVLPLLVIIYASNKSVIALGLLIAVTIGFLIFKFKLEKPIFLFTLLFVPFSVELEVITGLKVALPSEPLVAVLATATGFNLLLGQFDLKKLLFSPMVIIAFLYAAVLMIMSFSSTMPVPSFKFSLVNISYLFSFLVLPSLLIRQGRLKVLHIIYMLTVAFCALTIYTTYNYLILGNIADVSAIVPQPFYKDHTIHSATLSLVAPIFILAPLYLKSNSLKWLICAVGFAVFITMVVAGSRAAWMGFAAAMVFGTLVHFRVRIWHLLMVAIIGIGLGVAFWGSIEEHFFTNTMDSSAFDSSVEEQVKSLSNVTSDVSNLERLNRWKCALRMFNDKPYTGYGPGTYQFQFIPFQLSYETTPISVFSAYGYKDGTGGTAHSEYLLALAEMGIVGGVIVFILMIGIVYVLVEHKPKVTDVHYWLWIGLCVGLASFIVHGCLNNFLNSAGFGIIFWTLLSLVESQRIRNTIEAQQP
jgi:O-antigen ligase